MTAIPLAGTGKAQRGHQLIASRLYDELQKMQPNVLGARACTPTN
jgi:hypothetical protein